jgi:hypothetical protein
VTERARRLSHQSYDRRHQGAPHCR